MSEAKLTAALLAVQAEAPAIQRDAINPHFRSKYVSLDSLLGQILPILAKHGVLLVQSPTHIDGAPALTTALIHAESGDKIEATMPLVLDKATSQGQGSAITYARRYSLMALLGLVADADDDGNEASKPRPRRAPAQSPAATSAYSEEEPKKPPTVTELLKDLETLEPREDWRLVAREFTENNFDKTSVRDLTVQEKASLIEELRRRVVQLEADPGAVVNDPTREPVIELAAWVTSEDGQSARVIDAECRYVGDGTHEIRFGKDLTIRNGETLVYQFRTVL